MLIEISFFNYAGVKTVIVKWTWSEIFTIVSNKFNSNSGSQMKTLEDRIYKKPTENKVGWGFNAENKKKTTIFIRGESGNRRPSKPPHNYGVKFFVKKGLAIWID